MQILVKNGLIVAFFALGLWGPDLGASEVMVGAYYYPWYGPGTHQTSQAVRSRLKPAHDVPLGNYDSLSPAAITRHIAYSQQANIRLWASSWWGPDNRTDKAFSVILNHPDAKHLKYAILYETTGRLGDRKNPNYQRLISDFQYLQKNYFSHPNYFRIDDKPVVFIYVTRVYFRNPKGAEVIADLRKALPELYLIGDEIFNAHSTSEHVGLWDAVTAYDVYGQTLKPTKNSRKAIPLLESIYDNAQKSASAAGTAFVPFVTPGFNDRIIRDNPASPRYFADDKDSQEGDIFRTMLQKAVQRVDPKASNLLMVTSFNEWHEDTQIEPTAGTNGTTTQDDSETGTSYTQGYKFYDYGDLYLNILREETTQQN